MAATPDPAALLRELEARHQIHECLMRYCRGLDRLDPDLVASAFHEDAVDRHSFATLEGAESIARSLVERQRTKYRQTMHGILNEHVEVAGAVAHSETYWRASMVAEQDGREVLVEGAGRYVDRFERRAVGWRIASRVLVNEWSNWVPFSEPQSAPGNGAPPLRSRDDVSYRR